MLVLTRGVGQKILIGDDIVIQFVKQKGRQIVLGISAPKDIVILRDELEQKTRKDSRGDNDQ